MTDRLGSVRRIVDASGNALDDLVYDSFGGMVSESNPAEGGRFKFTGREFCAELDIYYYRARWYDPATGQFISPDPIGFKAGDTNLYRYVGNGPGDATDPLGQSPTLISGGIGAGVGAVVGGAFGWWNGTGFWSGAGHGFVVGRVTGLTAGAGTWLFGGTATTTMAWGTAGGFFGGVASDAVGQGVEIGLGWREKYSFTQNIFSGVLGTIFGAGSTIFRKCKAPIAGGTTTSGGTANAREGGRVFYGTPGGQIVEAPPGYVAVAAQMVGAFFFCRRGRQLAIMPTSFAMATLIPCTLTVTFAITMDSANR